MLNHRIIGLEGTLHRSGQIVVQSLIEKLLKNISQFYMNVPRKGIRASLGSVEVSVIQASVQ